MMNLLQTWLLITVMALSANGAVNAKVASGGINLSSELHQGLNDSKSLNALGISDVSTIHALSSSIVPNAGTRAGATDAEAGDFVRRNDGDRFDLQSHEGYRPPGSRSAGHLIDKHVGRTDAQLIARANGQNGQRAPLGGASSFSSSEAAQHFTSSTLKRNEAGIQQWLQSNPGNRPKAFQSTFDSATGRHVPNGGNASSNVNGAKIVLQRDASRSEGYRIITGHPVPVE